MENQAHHDHTYYREYIPQNYDDQNQNNQRYFENQDNQANWTQNSEFYSYQYYQDEYNWQESSQNFNWNQNHQQIGNVYWHQGYVPTNNDIQSLQTSTQNEYSSNLTRLNNAIINLDNLIMARNDASFFINNVRQELEVIKGNLNISHSELEHLKGELGRKNLELEEKNRSIESQRMRIDDLENDYKSLNEKLTLETQRSNGLQDRNLQLRSYMTRLEEEVDQLRIMNLFGDVDSLTSDDEVMMDPK